MYRPMGLLTPIYRYGDFPVVIIGTTTYNLKFGAPGAMSKREISR
jgi:hypothetical protein